MTRRHAGFTLIELVVVIALLGLLAALGAISFTSPRAAGPQSVAQRIRRARSEAIQQGHDVIVVVHDSESSRRIRVLPDGRIVADALLGLDAATGRDERAAR